MNYFENRSIPPLGCRGNNGSREKLRWRLEGLSSISLQLFVRAAALIKTDEAEKRSRKEESRASEFGRPSTIVIARLQEKRYMFDGLNRAPVNCLSFLLAVSMKFSS